MGASQLQPLSWTLFTNTLLLDCTSALLKLTHCFPLNISCLFGSQVRQMFIFSFCLYFHRRQILIGLKVYFYLFVIWIFWEYLSSSFLVLNLHKIFIFLFSYFFCFYVGIQKYFKNYTIAAPGILGLLCSSLKFSSFFFLKVSCFLLVFF